MPPPTTPASDTLFWENAALLLAVTQFALYLVGFLKQKDILVGFANDAEKRAEERSKAYESLRNKDSEFFEYYCNIPEYKECESNIRRSRGASDAKYGRELRRAYRATNGYSRMSMVGVTQHLSRQHISESANRRVMAKIAERSRLDDHVIQRWDAIISSPTNSAVNVNLNSAVEASFKTLGSFGRGVNSAGLTIGSLLWKKGY